MSRRFFPFDSLRSRAESEHTTPTVNRTVPPRVLFTGAGGVLGNLVLPALNDGAYAWRLADRADTMPTSGFPHRHVIDLGTDKSSHIFRDVDSVVHFAAQSKPAPAQVLHRTNVELVQWLLDNMLSAGISRLVYASSMHVVGLYDRHTAVRPADAPRPDSYYGESKLRAEQLIQAAASSHDLKALILRIGHAAPDASNAEPGNWLAIDDLAGLVRIGLTQQLPGAVIVHAVTPHLGDDLGQDAFSDATGMRWSKAPSYADAMKRVPQWYGNDTVAQQYRGGVFASGRADAEFGSRET